MTSPQESTPSPASQDGKCPYQDKNSSTTWWNPSNWFNKPNEVPASVEESLNHPVEKIYQNQTHDLDTQRTVSSIPRFIEDESEMKNQCPACDLEKKPNLPSHQPGNSNKWVYPSEQQFYNAMMKKGHKPSSQDVPTILKIHNAVNEKTWTQLLNVEKSLYPHTETPPQLLRFLGRPKDLSPKAFFNTYVLLYNPPFDRHDWYIVRGGDTDRPRRYVIDFYKGNLENGMYLDVRPAVDDLEGFKDRVMMFGRPFFTFEGKKGQENVEKSG